MNEVCLLKAIAETKGIKDRANEILNSLIDIAGGDGTEFDAQHAESLIGQEIAHLIVQSAALGLSFGGIVGNVINEMAENRPDLYEEFVAKSVL